MDGNVNRNLVVTMLWVSNLSSILEHFNLTPFGLNVVSFDYDLVSFYAYDKFVGSTERYKDVWRGWDIGIKPTFHFNPLLTERLANKIDIYLSGFAGYSYRALRYDKTNIYRDSLNYSTDGLSAGGIIGFRYFTSKKLGLYGELGKSSRWLIGGGITFKIR